MKKYDVITIGGATEDITFYTSEGILIDNARDLTRQKLLAFEYGAKIKIDKSFSGFGGGAANAAVHFSNFGFKTACVCAIGQDERGGRILNNFRKRRVGAELVQTSKRAETGYSFLLMGLSNEHIVFSSRAANDELKISGAALNAAKNVKWIYLASLSGQWRGNLEKIFLLKNARIAWNPGHRQIIAGIKVLAKYLENTACLIFNQDEAVELVMSDAKYKTKSHDFFRDPRDLLAALSVYGPKIVLITCGRSGAYAMAEGKIYHQSIVKEKSRVDTTGVGDAFGSAFVAGLELYKRDIRKSLLLAAKNAASVISVQGAQNGLLSKKDIKITDFAS